MPKLNEGWLHVGCDGMSGGKVALAWLVHGFTGLGAVLALFAWAAVDSGDMRLALLWLLAALAVDGIDGTLARRARVEAHLPRIDGAVLDLVIDYLNYVFIPTLIIWRGGFVLPGFAMILAGAIQLSSLYVFARRDMKTGDGYFRGFPGLWNVVAFYLVVATPGQTAATLVVAMLIVLTFAPVHFIHPFRARDYGWWPALVSIAWAITCVALLWPDWGEGAYRAWLSASLTTAVMIVALGLLRSIRGPRDLAAEA